MHYLSQDWIDEANAAVSARSPTAPDGAIVIDQMIDGAADYRITIGRDNCSIRALATDSATEAADVTFRQSVGTARAVALGETDAHQAFLLGQIRFTGDIDLLISRRDAFAWLEQALAPVIAQTTFD